MAELKTKPIYKNNNQELKNKYSWFYTNIYKQLVKNTCEFFAQDFDIRFMGVSYDDNFLFFGDEYFVNTITINKSSNFKIKISSGVIEYMLDSALGIGENEFKLQSLTDIEAKLIKSYILYVYKKFEKNINKEEPTKYILQNSKIINFTFFVRENDKHKGKIIISIPDYILPNTEEKVPEETFSLLNFRKVCTSVNIRIGSTRLALNDVKAIEDGDVILLEDSNINRMGIIYNNELLNFPINPNPSLIISIDNNGGEHMPEETDIKSQNMWDSILVDVVAEFDNVKLKLGELKQISEGLVIDVGSVYENKVKLRVENQVVATGELVILNDRYGVRIEKITKRSEIKKQATVKDDKSSEVKEEGNKQIPSADSTEKNEKEENANFDYSDFEIEDESI